MKGKQMRPSLLEALAYLEHERWARWQKHLHSKCERHTVGALTIRSDDVAHWERQIKTTYPNLSEQEKESDRKEARNTIEVLKEYGIDVEGK